mmetsp:Transcript_41504/g.93785  ORF Transcript_41504/g.93785 Transcript_41504/m.93785 type:complete len:213 (-) Transcript_41504:80-718(-)
MPRLLLLGRVRGLEHGHRQLGEAVSVEGTTRRDHLDVDAVLDQPALLLERLIPLTLQLGETPVLRVAQPLAPRELVLGAAERLHDLVLVDITGAHRQQDLANLNTGDSAVCLTKRSTHASLQTIGARAGKHLVDAKHVPRVHADTQVEGLLAGGLHHVLVAGDTGRLERLRGQLLLLHTHHVSGKGEVIDRVLLLARIIDANLGVRHSAVEA